jgi:hypothetical protein
LDGAKGGGKPAWVGADTYVHATPEARKWWGEQMVARLEKGEK